MSALFFSSALGAGCPGFVSLFGWSRWLQGAEGNPWVLGTAVFLFFLLAALAWKIPFLMREDQALRYSGWYEALVPWVALIGVSALWSGSISGFSGLFEGDQLSTGVIEGLRINAAAAASDPLQAPWVVGVLALGILGLGMALWTNGGGRNKWQSLIESAPRFSSFVAGGYGLSTVGRYAVGATQWVGRWTQHWSEASRWDERLVGLVVRAGQPAGRLLTRVSDQFSGQLDQNLGSAVGAPGKLLQLIHSGNVQWYIVFAIGSGVAVLLHFIGS
jgi:hypothetical protein